MLREEDLDAEDACDLVGHDYEEEPLETRYGDSNNQDAQTHICLAPINSEEVVNIIMKECELIVTYLVAAATTAVISSAKIANK